MRKLVPWALFVAGAVYMVWGAWQAAYSPSMDYAVVVEMARNMASGSDWPTFFYGQAYMGSLEPAASALLCRLFGTHPFWVCMGSALLGIVALFAVMRIAWRLGGSAGASIALALAICAGPYWLHFEVSPRGGYALASLLCLLAVYLGAIVDFSDKGTGRVRIWPSAAIGLAAGLAFWNFWLALPAFAAAGLMLLHRLRARLFSWRFVIPASMAFIIGSAPWWIFAYRHGLGAFMEDSGQSAPYLYRAVTSVINVVAVRFFGVANTPAAFWRSSYPWPLAAMLLFAAFDAAFVRDRLRWRFLATTAIHTALFFAAYTFTSFGSLKPARYFVHLVPLFSVACGAAIGAAFMKARAEAAGSWKGVLRNPRCLTWPSAAAVVLLAWAILTAPRSIRATNSFMVGLSAKGEKWSAAMKEAAKDPSLHTPAFADFRYFGANWVTDRRLCFVSPFRWRYAPYLDSLEHAEAPALISDSQSFGQFCQATMGTCRTRAVSNLAVTDQMSPPPEMHEVAAEHIAGAFISGGHYVSAALFDDNLGTSAALRGGASHIDITFDQPRTNAGVVAIVTYSERVRGWRAEAVGPSGETLETLASCNPIGGWFWSGPRPFMFGPDARLELRWEPRPLSRIRIVFEKRQASIPEEDLVAYVADMRVLSGDPLPPINIDEVVSAVEKAKGGMAGSRVHAGRWVGLQVGAWPDPALTFGRLGGSLTIPEVCQYTAISADMDSVVVMRGDAADAAGTTLSALGVTHSRVDAGGCSVFTVRRFRRAGDASRLRFYGGRLLRDEAEASTAAGAWSPATFGGKWNICGKSPIPEEITPGQTLNLELLLSAADKRKCAGGKMVQIFVHAVRDGAIVFSGGVGLNTTAAMLPADDPRPIDLSIPLKVPANIAPGRVELMVCMKNPGSRLRMAPSGDGIKTSKRRVIIGSAVCPP